MNEIIVKFKTGTSEVTDVSGNTIAVNVYTNYQIKKSYAALLKFEELTGRGVNEMKDNVTDLLTLFYCILSAGNDNFNYTFKDFIKVIDDNENAVEVFNEYLMSQIPTEPIPTEQAKKKVTKKQ